MDVDTCRGLSDGVPRLLELFRRLGLHASFFVSMGPDHSGRALRRAWRPRFLLKMWRTNPFRLYGVRTLLSGTLLRARLVGAGAPTLLRQIAAEGHEVGPHGFDHVEWQDKVHRWNVGRIRADLGAAADAFAAVFGEAPRTSAAPGWRVTPQALAVQEERGYSYASDVRGRGPFRPRVDGAVLRTLQLPTTMPTMDEVLGRVRDIPGRIAAAVRPGLNVFTLHAEVEGGALLETFEEVLARLRRQRAEIVPMREAVAWLRAAAGPLDVSPIGRGRVPGRSGWVAIQAVQAP